MRSQFDGLLETRVSESGRALNTVKKICCICGESAQGNASFVDSGEQLCDNCACEDVFDPNISINGKIADSIDDLLR